MSRDTRQGNDRSRIGKEESTPHSARTPWFDSGVKPARRGVYEREIGTIGLRFSYWNGKFWGGFAVMHSHAMQNRYSPTAHEDARWRGLARKP